MPEVPRLVMHLIFPPLCSCGVGFGLASLVLVLLYPSLFLQRRGAFGFILKVQKCHHPGRTLYAFASIELVAAFAFFRLRNGEQSLTNAMEASALNVLLAAFCPNVFRF